MADEPVPVMGVGDGHGDSYGAAEASGGRVSATLGGPVLHTAGIAAPERFEGEDANIGTAQRADRPLGEPPVGEAKVVDAPVGESLPELALSGAAAVVVSTEDLRERAGVAVFRRAARSPNTLAAYRADWARFAAWCTRHGATALPAEAGVVASYLAQAANLPDPGGRSAPWRYSPNTLGRWLATINKAHDLAGLLAPGRQAEVTDVLAGIRRARATPPRRKTPLLLADLERIVTNIETQAWPQAPGGIRNRCLLLMGWIGAFRRDELVRLEIGDVTLHPDDGLHVLVRQSKSDPEAQGRTYALPYSRQVALCAPCAFIRWRALLGAWDGTDGGPGGRAGVMRATRADDPDRHLCRHPDTVTSATGEERTKRLFRSVKANGTIGGPLNGEAVNQVVKRSAQAAGFDPRSIGGHSLRAGFVTQAFRTGATPHAIMRQTGHRDPKTLEIYARETAPLVGNAVTQLGL